MRCFQQPSSRIIFRNSLVVKKKIITQLVGTSLSVSVPDNFSGGNLQPSLWSSSGAFLVDLSRKCVGRGMCCVLTLFVEPRYSDRCTLWYKGYGWVSIPVLTGPALAGEDTAARLRGKHVTNEDTCLSREDRRHTSSCDTTTKRVSAAHLSVQRSASQH